MTNVYQPSTDGKQDHPRAARCCRKLTIALPIAMAVHARTMTLFAATVRRECMAHLFM